MSAAAQRWSAELAAWAVPQEILDAAPKRPHVPGLAFPTTRVTLWWDVPGQPR